MQSLLVQLLTLQLVSCCHACEVTLNDRKLAHLTEAPSGYRGWFPHIFLQRELTGGRNMNQSQPVPGLLEAIAFRLEAIASSLEKTYTKWSLRVDSTCTARTARGPRGPCAALCAAPPLTPCAAVSHAFAVAVCTALCHSSRACGGCCE